MVDIPKITEEILEQIDPEEIKNIKIQLQKINDTLQGGLRSANSVEYRNTYVINAQDSLDASYPMYIHFNIIPEMVKIVEIKVSFWFLNFRAYSTAATSGGAVSSASGGGETPTSSSGGAVSSASGGGETPTTSSGGASTPTSGADSVNWATTFHKDGTETVVTAVGAENASGQLPSGNNICASTAGHQHTVTIAAHTHTVTVAAHTHTGGAHTHTVTVAAHTHTGGAHTHGITYGIFEDSTSPTVMLYVSRDNGLTYSLPTGSYTADHENLDITSMIDTAGGKMIKFTSNARTRLSVQITVKLDISAR